MQIVIGPLTYKVVKVKELACHEGLLHGDINFNKCRIRIDASDNPQRQHQTLWHEILHGILRGAGNKDDHDEQQIDALAHGIIQVLRDNPQLRGGSSAAEQPEKTG